MIPVTPAQRVSSLRTGILYGSRSKLTNLAQRIEDFVRGERIVHYPSANGVIDRHKYGTWSGRMLNSNLIDYKWRTFDDMPPFTNVILETPMPSHRFHAVGVGEIATSPGPSAVLMAVYNAIGRRIMDYPFTPDKVLKALGKIKES